MINMHPLLDRPIAFHPGLVPVTGSVNAALMLSQALYWTKRTNDGEGWFWKTAEEWTDETALSKKEQITARKKLNKTVFWCEDRKGKNKFQNTIYYRVDISLLMEELGKSTRELSIVPNGNSRELPMGTIEGDQPEQSEVTNGDDRQLPKGTVITENTTETTSENTTESTRGAENDVDAVSEPEGAETETLSDSDAASSDPSPQSPPSLKCDYEVMKATRYVPVMKSDPKDPTKVMTLSPESVEEIFVCMPLPGEDVEVELFVLNGKLQPRGHGLRKCLRGIVIPHGWDQLKNGTFYRPTASHAFFAVLKETCDDENSEILTMWNEQKGRSARPTLSVLVGIANRLVPGLKPTLEATYDHQVGIKFATWLLGMVTDSIMSCGGLYPKGVIKFLKMRLDGEISPAELIAGNYQRVGRAMGEVD